MIGYNLCSLTVLPSFAQWRYSNQWSNREVLLLLVENYTQYPALLVWNITSRGNFWRPSKGQMYKDCSRMRNYRNFHSDLNLNQSLHLRYSIDKYFSKGQGIICPGIFNWSFFTPEERSWIRFNPAGLGYTPLVEVNQALIAWSFRQPVELFLAHPTGLSEIRFLNLLHYQNFCKFL